MRPCSWQIREELNFARFQCTLGIYVRVELRGVVLPSKRLNARRHRVDLTCCLRGKTGSLLTTSHDISLCLTDYISSR